MACHEHGPFRFSAWMSVLVPKTPRLDGDARVDVCVVGGGIAGLTTAYLLAREGRSVLVLDDGEPGSGMTRMTTAHLANALDDRYAALERLRGGDAARLAAESHTAAITRIQSIARLENIDCGFRRLDGFLFSPAGDGAGLEQELQAARRAGVHGVDRLERAPLPSFDTGPCLVFPGQAQFHPLKYLAGLVAAIGRYGGRVCGGTHVDAVMPGKPARVQAGIHQITADAVVVATNIPIHHRLALHLKQAAYMTYVIAARVPRHAVPTALYWDTADPYHYVRLQPGEGLEDDLLIVGGEDHRTGQAHDADARQDRLEAWARERFPITGPVAFRWSGQVVETPDGLAYIGRDGSTEGNVYVATGDSGMGMTHGTIAGVLITDQIFGRANPWEDLYDPLRRPAGALAEFAPETMRSMAPLADWLTPGEGGRAVDLRPGEGAVLRRGLAKAAVYRDEEGTLHEFSAVCPHLGCLVRWNGFDKTFDCPCHGSRFDRCGHVINGPANEGLKAL